MKELTASEILSEILDYEWCGKFYEGEEYQRFVASAIIVLLNHIKEDTQNGKRI